MRLLCAAGGRVRKQLLEAEGGALAASVAAIACPGGQATDELRAAAAAAQGALGQM